MSSHQETVVPAPEADAVDPAQHEPAAEATVNLSHSKDNELDLRQLAILERLRRHPRSNLRKLLA